MSIVNYTTEVEKQQAANAAAERDRKNREAFGELLARHELLANTEANFKELVRYAQGELTVGKGEYFLNNPPEGWTLTFRDERNTLIEAIIKKMHDPTQKRFTSFDEKMLRKALAYKSRVELVNKLADVTRRQTAAAKTVQELKADLAQMRKAETAGQKYPGWPVFPKSGWSKDGGPLRQVAYDIPYLKSLDAYEIRRLHKLYGPYLDDRLAGRD